MVLSRCLWLESEAAAYLALMTLSVRGSMQFTLQSVMPSWLHIEMENRP